MKIADAIRELEEMGAKPEHIRLDVVRGSRDWQTEWRIYFDDEITEMHPTLDEAVAEVRNLFTSSGSNVSSADASLEGGL